MDLKFLLGLMLNGAEDAFKRLLGSVKTDHIKSEFGHWVKGRLGTDPHILHPSSTARMLFGSRTQMDALNAKIDAALAGVNLGQAAGPLLAVISPIIIKHIQHK